MSCGHEARAVVRIVTTLTKEERAHVREWLTVDGEERSLTWYMEPTRGGFSVTVDDPESGEVPEQIAGRIMQQVAESVGRAIEALLEEYDVEPDRLRADVAEFVESLRAAGLIRVSAA